VTATLLRQVRQLRQSLTGDACRCGPLLVEVDGPHGTTQAPPTCPNCGRVPRLLEVAYGTDFYDHVRLSGATTS
jgi:hypothetical protein